MLIWFSTLVLKVYRLVSTRCALEKTCVTSHFQLEGQGWGTASHPPDPHLLLWLLRFC